MYSTPNPKPIFPGYYALIPFLIVILVGCVLAAVRYCMFCMVILTWHKGNSCPNITTQCLRDQRCSSSTGRYGLVHILSAQGCVDADICGSHEIVSYQGVRYNVSHTCCCKDKCNLPPKSDVSLKMLHWTFKASLMSKNNE
uniref:UPAR/Ly6 domain-containing protein n=1 Tax=Mola mola TaxID=94237 RepID=A0A3Q3WLZ8_MOLML